MIDRRLRATVLLAEAAALGVGLEDLIAAHAAPRPPAPTLADHIAAVAPTFGPGTAATYGSYWRLALHHFGDRRLTEITVVDLQLVVADAARRAQQSRPGSTGRPSQETCVAALRAAFHRAYAAGLIATNPAAAVTKPRRARSRRRALDETELAELIEAIRTTSNDPDLDLLLVRFHLETGARRQGALNLRLGDIDTRRATVWLRKKNTSDREQPLSPALARILYRHATTRGAHHPGDPAFRRQDGAPITARRYNTIFDRARPSLPWATRTPVSAHVLRHTAINITDVATTIATLTGEPHPLAPPATRRCQRT